MNGDVPSSKRRVVPSISWARRAVFGPPTHSRSVHFARNHRLLRAALTPISTNDKQRGAAARLDRAGVRDTESSAGVRPPGSSQAMEASTIALSPEDRAILDLESPRIAGHTCKVIVLEGRLGIDELRDEITKRLEAAPELSRRLDGPADAPVWRQDRDLDPTAHIVSANAAVELDQDGLRTKVGELFAQRLDRSRPLWRIDVLPLAEGGSALVWRIHHALADGTTAIRLARAVLFDAGIGSAGAPARPASTHAAEDDARRRHHLAGLLRREFVRSRTSSPFDARIGTRREVEFARVPLRPLHDGAKRLAGATLNDAVLACVAGGLRHWIEQHHGQLDDLRVKVPVSLHQEGDAVGNRDSTSHSAYPSAKPTPSSGCAGYMPSRLSERPSTTLRRSIAWPANWRARRE